MRNYSDYLKITPLNVFIVESLTLKNFIIKEPSKLLLNYNNSIEVCVSSEDFLNFLTLTKDLNIPVEELIFRYFIGIVKKEREESFLLLKSKEHLNLRFLMFPDERYLTKEKVENIIKEF